MPMARKWQEIKPVMEKHPKPIKTQDKKPASLDPYELVRQMRKLFFENGYYTFPLSRTKHPDEFLAVPRDPPSPDPKLSKEWVIKIRALGNISFIVRIYRTKVRIRPFEGRSLMNATPRKLLERFGQEGERLILSRFPYNPTRAKKHKNVWDWWQLIPPEERKKAALLLGLSENFFENASL